MINKSVIQKETIQSAIVLHSIHYISCLYLMLFRATLLRFFFFFDSLYFNDQHANQLILCTLFWSRNEFSLFIHLNILRQKMYRCPGFSYLIREYDFLLWRNSTWAMAFLLSTKSKKKMPCCALQQFPLGGRWDRGEIILMLLQPIILPTIMQNRKKSSMPIID